MTCIVGIEKDGQAFIGGDSACGYESMVRVIESEKVFNNYGFVIGYTSSFRMGQILRHQIPSYELADKLTSSYSERYVVSEFIESIRKAFKDLGYAKIESNEESGGSFLLGVRGNIWLVESDYQVERFADGLYAIGCGAEFALGALKATEDMPIEKRILNALEISAYYSAFVKPPFTILQVK